MTLIVDGTAGLTFPNSTVQASAGSVLQVVNFQTGTNASGTGVIPFDNTIPQNTEGTEFMTLAITPKFSTSKLKIDVVFISNNNVSSSSGFIVALFQDTTANALASCPQNITNNLLTCSAFSHYMTAGTTSSTTFKIRAGGGTAGTTVFNTSVAGGTLASSITISEIAG
jgi:hypothetical protein